MRTTVAMTEATYQALASALALDVETAYTAILGVAENDGESLLFCIRQLEPVHEQDYLERTNDRLVISSSGFMPTFAKAASMQSLVAFIHTHPNALAAHSDLDDRVDEALAPVAMVRTGRRHYVSLIVGGSAENPSFGGRVVSADGAVDLTSVRVIGERLRVFSAEGLRELNEPDRATFDRQIRAFGEAGQSLLRRLRIGIVGVGGTGSAVAEQIARLGVGETMLVDDDVITSSNISRVYGSTSQVVGVPKVEAVARHLRQIRPSMRVDSVVGRVTTHVVAQRLRFCDVIFGCTDDQWGRSILARLSYWYLIPLIDLAVMVTSDGSKVDEVIGRVTYVGPGSPCLLCRGRLQADAIRTESLSSEERSRLAAEGYVQGLAEIDPSVVTYTTGVAAIGTSELLQRLIGLGQPPYPQELLWRADTAELRRNRVSCAPGHYCASSDLWGSADVDPFLGQLWT
jgi:hypothetical protein